MLQHSPLQRQADFQSDGDFQTTGAERQFWKATRDMLQHSPASGRRILNRTRNPAARYNATGAERQFWKATGARNTFDMVADHRIVLAIC